MKNKQETSDYELLKNGMTAIDDALSYFERMEPSDFRCCFISSSKLILLICEYYCQMFISDAVKEAKKTRMKRKKDSIG